MRDFMLITKALAEKNRVRALAALSEAELCVCQITSLLELAPPTVSKHMSILRNARLVSCEKRGRWNYYRIAGENAPGEVREAIAWVIKNVGESPRIREDFKRLKKIIKIDPEELCRRML